MSTRQVGWRAAVLLRALLSMRSKMEQNISHSMLAFSRSSGSPAWLRLAQ
ncbi:hypothetical protein [Hydrogenophaga sp.]|nr:hypothetical protein [Hydrogenophaga sp.]